MAMAMNAANDYNATNVEQCCHRHDGIVVGGVWVGMSVMGSMGGEAIPRHDTEASRMT